MGDFRSPQTPGLGGLSELTGTELTLVEELDTIAHADGTLIVSSAGIWAALPIGTDNQVLAVNGTEIGWEAAGSGDVSGPASSVDNRIARFDGATGKTLQSSSAVIDDSGNILPYINNTPQLGSATSSWADLFIGDGGVINFNNGDVTVTHSSNKLDIDGGVVDFGSAPTVADAAIYYVGGTDVAIEDGGTGASTSAGARTNLGLVIGTNLQAWDNDLDDIAALAHSTSALMESNGTDWVARTPVQVRGDLGLVIGTNVQAFDAQLTDIAAITPASSAFVGSNATNLIVRSAAEVRGDLGLIVGTNVQAWDAQLDDIAALAVTDSNIIVGNGANWVAESGATARTSLGVGTTDRPQFAGLGLGVAAETSASINLPPGGGIHENGQKIKRTIVLSAAGGDGAATSACADPATTAVSGIDFWYMEYDPNLEEVGYWNIALPDNYDGGTMTAKFYWSSTATTGNIIWAISGRSYANDAAIGQASGTQVEFLDVALAANDMHITAESSAFTLAGTPAGGEYASFRVHRKATNANDTLAAEGRLLMVKLEYFTSALSD